MSAKTSAQQGRRTPLSLSGTVTKSQPNKGPSSIANGGGNNANGQPTSNSKQQDNKIQQKTDQPAVSKAESKENPNKRQQPQNDKKPQQNENKKSTEKNQNGVNSNKQQETNENKQQQQSKEKAQQQNGKEDNKANENGKSEKSEKSEKLENIDTAKVKEDKKGEQNILDNKKEERKAKDSKDLKEFKKEESTQKEDITEGQKQIKDEDKQLKDDDKAKCVDKVPEESIVKMDIVENQTQQNSSSKPITPKSSSKTNKASTIVNKTPSKIGEKTPQKSTPTSSAKSTPVTKREVTTTIDDNDIEMEPLAIESSPVKLSQPEEAVNAKIIPSATSTPGKLLLPKRNTGVPKSDVELADISPERPRMFSQITGRKSIRPISDYTPSKFQSNLQFRESYRRINTELDVTNTSMNVTVGSEVPNNLSFSFFGRGRKRDRTPQHSQSAIGELQTDIEISPPKKARIDMHGLFSAVSSPLTLLRNRFSKASLQSSTPLKLQQKLTHAEDEIEVQNVSGISMHEEIASSGNEAAETSTVIDGDDVTLGEEIKETKLKEKISSSYHVEVNSEEKELKVLPCDKACGKDQTCEQLGINITGTPLQTAVGDPISKNKKCVVM